jgi:hypothetical protein
VSGAGQSRGRASLGLGSQARGLAIKGNCSFTHSVFQCFLSPVISLALCLPKVMGLNPGGTWEPLRDTEQGQHISFLVTVFHTVEPQHVPGSSSAPRESAEPLPSLQSNPLGIEGELVT